MMKTFKIDGDEYKAEDCIDDIFINPVLPDNFYTQPLKERSEEHMRLWQDLPFIVSDNDFYKVYCLDGGAWDRATLRGGLPPTKSIGYAFGGVFSFSPRSRSKVNFKTI